MDYEAKAREFVNIMPQMKHRPKRAAVEKISKGEMHMLGHLHMSGGSMMAGEIAKCAEVSTARIAAMIKGCEEKGYVERSSVEGDRRKIKVTLTDKGRDMMIGFYDEAIKNTAQYFEALGPEDTEHLLRIMYKTREIFEKGERTE